tara:strand:+ start:480 stop:674 length:195 start_codon:yes stop_codon:yes gene_type:complete
MDRRQVFELETDYIIKDLRNGIKAKEELIRRSKARRLIPHNLRDLWYQQCFLKAQQIYTDLPLL